MTNYAEMAQQRIAIAQDVLKWLAQGTIVASTGIYIESECDADKFIGYDNAQKHIKQLVENCQVCAKGALFAGMVHRYNGVTIEQFFDYDGGKSKLDEFFERNQLSMIEAAFEGWAYINRDGGEDELSDRVWEFYEKYEDAEDRMQAIMNNIIKNQGEFVP